MSSSGDNQFGNSVDRCAEHQDVGALGCDAYGRRPLVDATKRLGFVQTGLIALDAQDRIELISAPCRQTDRAADQADADDSEALRRHFRGSPLIGRDDNEDMV
jgi:hypothetical protein